MQLVLSFGMILGCSLAGEALHALLPLPVPSGVYGLCLLLLLLCTGCLKPDTIRSVSSFLVELLPLLLVPAAVNILQDWGVLQPVLVPFGLAVTALTALVMGATALIVQRFEGGDKHDRLSD